MQKPLKINIAEIIFEKSYLRRSVFLGKNIIQEKMNKWIKVFKIDLSVDQDIFIATILIRHLAELRINETRLISDKAMEQLRFID